NEERDEVHDREARIEEHAPEGVRRVRDEEEDPEEEEDPRDAGREQGEEREEDEALFPPEDAQADLRQLPADAQPFVETESPRSRGKRPESGRRRDGRRRRPHGDRAPIWSGLHQPTGGTPRSRKNDCVGSHVGATQMDLDSSQEKLLKKTANTRAPAADETLLAGLEEARKDALEMAQEADAPPQERAEDASAVSHHLHRRGGGPPFRVDSTDENWSVAFHVLGKTIDGRDAQRIPDRAIRSARRQPRIRAVAQRHEDRLPAHRTRDP